MPMMTSQILKFVHLTNTQKSWEQNIVFSPNKKIHQLHILGYFIVKNTFAAEVTFKHYE